MDKFTTQLTFQFRSDRLENMSKKSETKMMIIHRNNLIYLAAKELHLPAATIAQVFKLTRQYVDKLLNKMEVS